MVNVSTVQLTLQFKPELYFAFEDCGFQCNLMVCLFSGSLLPLNYGTLKNNFPY